MAANWKMIVASAAVLAGSIVGAAGLTAWWMRPPLPQPPILSPATVQASVPPLPTPPTGDQKPLLPKDPLGVGAKVVVLTEGATVHLAVDELAFREMPAGVTTKTLEMIGEGRLRLITDNTPAVVMKTEPLKVFVMVTDGPIKNDSGWIEKRYVTPIEGQD